MDEALDLSEELVDPDEAAEAEADDSIQDNGELADNAGMNGIMWT